jgi:hypothetical protein
LYCWRSWSLEDGYERRLVVAFPPKNPSQLPLGYVSKIKSPEGNSPQPLSPRSKQEQAQAKRSQTKGINAAYYSNASNHTPLETPEDSSHTRK